VPNYARFERSGPIREEPDPGKGSLKGFLTEEFRQAEGGRGDGEGKKKKLEGEPENNSTIRGLRRGGKKKGSGLGKLTDPQVGKQKKSVSHNPPT